MKNVKTSLINFILVGIMNGVIISLIAAYFLEYLVDNYAIICPVTYMEWVLILAPCFALVLGLFNALVGIFILEEPKKKRRFLVFKAK